MPVILLLLTASHTFNNIALPRMENMSIDQEIKKITALEKISEPTIKVIGYSVVCSTLLRFSIEKILTHNYFYAALLTAIFLLMFLAVCFYLTGNILKPFFMEFAPRKNALLYTRSITTVWAAIIIFISFGYIDVKKETPSDWSRCATAPK